jgi:dihydroorotate dehydrogenase (fumarate)
MIDLSTSYLGLILKNPLVASAGPLSKDIDQIRRMEDAGLSAIVLHSLFEEQITIESQQLDRFLDNQADSYAESLSYFPNLTSYNIGPDAYLEHIRIAKETVKVPVVASLNGTSVGGWIRYANLMEQAGADALELNFYAMPTDPDITGASLEDTFTELVSEIQDSIQIPVAVKIGPYFSSIPNIARKLDSAGAKGLVLFNRFYQPDFDLETLEVMPNLTLSNSSELLLRLHWVAILHGRIRADLAITGGVHTAVDVVKSMMAGAKIAMTTSALLRRGTVHATQILNDLSQWLEDHEYESVKQMQGSMSYRSVSDTTAFERGNYMKVLSSYSLRSAIY